MVLHQFVDLFLLCQNKLFSMSIYIRSKWTTEWVKWTSPFDPIFEVVRLVEVLLRNLSLRVKWTFVVSH